MKHIKNKHNTGHNKEADAQEDVSADVDDVSAEQVDDVDEQEDGAELVQDKDVDNPLSVEEQT